jgi:glycosyltransferase involved in cell wall biosynthesis
MKVLVAINARPFKSDEADDLARRLVTELQATAGVNAELLRLPPSPPGRGLQLDMLVHTRFSIPNVDRLIALTIPAFAMSHPCKILWSLKGEPTAEKGGAAPSDLSRLFEISLRHDPHALRNASSKAQQHRFNERGIDADILYPASPDPGAGSSVADGDYILVGGALSPFRRQHLLVQALRLLDEAPRLVIAGEPETQDYGKELQQLVQTGNLCDKVELRLAPLSRSQTAELANGAFACVCLPNDGHCLDCGIAEALAAGKPIITWDDAIDAREFMVDGATGLIVNPEPTAIAAAFTRLWRRPADTKRMGFASLELGAKLFPAWRTIVERLLI